MEQKGSLFKQQVIDYCAAIGRAAGWGTGGGGSQEPGQQLWGATATAPTSRHPVLSLLGVVGLGAGGAGGQRSAPSMPPACSSVQLSWCTQMAVSACGHLTVMDFRQVINFHEVAFIVLAHMASPPATSLYWDSAGSDYFQIAVFLW